VLIAFAIGFVLVGCPPGGGGDEGQGEEGVGEGEPGSEGAAEGAPTIEGLGEGEAGGGTFDGETIVLPGGVELEMISIPAGTFMMGSNNGFLDERPVHNVTLTQDFQLGKYEVTKAQWEAVMGTTPWSGQSFVLDDPNTPATRASWNDVQTFITTLNGLTGETFRLPTEAEWEYACRGGTATEYYFGDSSANLSDYAWYEQNAYSMSEQFANVVGQLLPNAFGLFDMHGNVWEWCEDWYDSTYYSSSPSTDPPGPSSGSEKVLRSGGWAHISIDSRSARRQKWDPFEATGFQVIGIRLAR